MFQPWSHANILLCTSLWDVVEADQYSQHRRHSCSTLRPLGPQSSSKLDLGLCSHLHLPLQSSSIIKPGNLGKLVNHTGRVVTGSARIRRSIDRVFRHDARQDLVSPQARHDEHHTLKHLRAVGGTLPKLQLVCSRHGRRRSYKNHFSLETVL